MTISVIHIAPQKSSYTELSLYESSTPESFNMPVLHFSSPGCTIEISKAHATSLPPFSRLSNNVESPDNLIFDSVELWVTTQKLIFFDPASSVGSEIPFTSLSLHAIKKQRGLTGIYMMIALSPESAAVTNSDQCDDDEIVELTVIPSPEAEFSTQETIALSAFKALSQCASLHPDPMSDGDSDALDGKISIDSDEQLSRLEGFPGQGGWITAENVDQFSFDVPHTQNPTEVILGPGAGSVRTWEDSTAEKPSLADETVATECKWRRTS
ncbi:regulator of volume decrease after cellular swelling-domain-containing protein [Geopyxis carbonaria]|nr:regulator of volume decrease after cellular swelling-domain-containing protein [Geopyxis carbonaria]